MATVCVFGPISSFFLMELSDKQHGLLWLTGVIKLLYFLFMFMR